jgi:hypothetical protein
MTTIENYSCFTDKNFKVDSQLPVRTQVCQQVQDKSLIVKCWNNIKILKLAKISLIINYLSVSQALPANKRTSKTADAEKRINSTKDLKRNSGLR